LEFGKLGPGGPTVASFRASCLLDDRF